MAGLTRYVVRSSDVLEDMRINVFDQGSNTVIWYKERFLTDDEILEHIVENATSTLLWTVHRPKRGWYLRLRAPSFPPGVFIPLLPVPQTSPYHAEAALSFVCRTNPNTNPPSTASTSASAPAPASFASSDTRPPMLTNYSTDSEITLTDDSAPLRPHSYPPTPPPPPGPVLVVRAPSPPSTVHKRLAAPSLSLPRPVSIAITHFLLTPRAPDLPAASIFTRLVAAIKNSAPSHSYSFTLAPVPALASCGSPGSSPAPVLAFHDRTPVWTARCSTGLIEMDEGRCRVLGVEPAFYVAVALTYLEFLEDRESYLVAAHD